MINSETLQENFMVLVRKYDSEVAVAENLWLEITKHYSSKDRYYHNLKHLAYMYMELEQFKERISDWDTALFSLYYHDIIYSATAKDNEKKSAEMAAVSLRSIDYPESKIKLCTEQIIATKEHEPNENADTCYLLDADMAILGSSWENYEAYFKAVRKEYAIYPDFIYKPGRKKVLQHFLSSDSIFSTPEFREKYEQIARENIAKELALII